MTDGKVVIIGKVIKGDGRGRTLGYPTANIAVPDGFAAANGVYAASVEVDGARYGAMVNLGIKPTFGGCGRVLELHLFDFSGDLYGREVTVELVEYIRPEQRFPTLEALRARIEKDEREIKTLFDHLVI